MSDHEKQPEDVLFPSGARELHALPALDEPVPVRLAVGEVLAERFVIEALAGMGGMGAVYRARDLEAGLPVAVKVVSRRREHSHDRFATEALALAELSHPRVVRYVAHGVTSAGAPYLAMEWLEGEDLGARLARVGLDVAETIAVVRGLAEGLAVAHAKGIIHRDIKPSNIFLVGGDAAAVKLLDFGVARRSAAPLGLTRAGTLLGTVGYMAPEQAMGKLDLDARADVFALGCVLFECLTGKPAFSANHDVAVLAKVLRGDRPQLRALRPDLSHDVDLLLNQLLAREPTQRPADAGVVFKMLDALVGLSGGAPSLTGSLDGAPFLSGEQRMLSVILGGPRGPAATTIAPEQARAAQNLEELTRAYGAELTPIRGGALLLVMSSIRAATAADQATQAARCALALRKAYPELALGVATGGVNTSSQVPVGDAIDRAAALLAEANEAGTITLDPLTAGLLGERFAIDRAGARLLLVAELEETETRDLLMGRATPFVGRAKELGLLEATLQECIADGVARGVLVTAPSGAGKSRLGREFGERVKRGGGARMLVARADPTSAGSSLHLVKRLLRAASGLRQGISHGSERGRLEQYLQPLVARDTLPFLLDFLGELVGLQTDQAPSARLRAARNDPEVMREQKRRAFERWVDAETAHEPLVLLLEDLHWGDLPSVSYLQDVLRVFSRRPLMLLALARPEVHEHFPKLREDNLIDEVRLKALTSRASEQLVRTVLPASVDQAVVTRIVGLAEGNAFYLEELVRRVAQGGTELPDTVVAMAQSRLDVLPPESRRVLRAASVFGETAWTGGIGALVGGGDTLALCNNLAEQEILIRRTDARFPNEREFAFRHAFLREAAYALLSETDRTIGHRKAAEWLEARGERDARLLADHFERGGAAERAIPWLVLAAIGALDGGDIEGALALTQRGLDLHATGRDRGMLLLFHAYASTWSCMQNDLALLREALELLPRATAPWWLAVSLQVYNASIIGQPELAGPYLQLALTNSPDSELTGVYGQALQTLASGAALMGRAEVGWRLVRQFEQIMDAQSDTQLDRAFVSWFDLSRCVLASNSTSEGGWQLGDAVAWGRQSVLGMQAAGSAAGETITLFYLGNIYLLLGCYEEAESLLRRSLTLATQMGNLLVQRHVELVMNVFSLRAGATEQGRRSLAKLALSSNANISHGARCMLAESEWREGKLEEAVVSARIAASGPSLLYRRNAACTLARSLVALGRHEEALVVVAAAREGSASAFPQFELDLACSRAQAQLGSGAHEDARQTCERARRFRAEVAANIGDHALRTTFLTRGQSNPRLDALTRALGLD